MGFHSQEKYRRQVMSVDMKGDVWDEVRTSKETESKMRKSQIFSLLILCCTGIDN